MDIPNSVPLPLSLTLAVERWPIAGAFAISRGAKTEAVVVVAELGDGKARGRGECVPYARYGESVESVCGQIEAMRPQLAAGLTRVDLQRAMPPGAARNALDCAFWDLEAKRSGRPVHELAGLAAPHPLTTAYTISLGAPPRWPRQPKRPPAARCSRSSSAAERRCRAHRRGARRSAQGGADRRCQ